MITQETKGLRKSKVELADYDYERDIQTRMALSALKEENLPIIEELLYSPLKLPLSKLAKNLDLSEEDLLSQLSHLSPLKLFKIEGSEIHIDKDQRKYIETQIEKFDEDFRPGMEFLQSLLKGVPIHTLPSWYHIPRSSNNIFESILEKYLLTPQTFQRHLTDFAATDPLYARLIAALQESPTHSLPATALREMVDLSPEEFEKLVLYLEFNFICCLTYRKEDEGWSEEITFFQEWKEHLLFLKNSTPPAQPNKELISPTRPNEYAFVEDMSSLLRLAISETVTINPSVSISQITGALEDFSYDAVYVERLIQKILLLGLATAPGGALLPTEPCHEWLATPIDKRAHIAFKHPHNHLSLPKLNSAPATDRHLVEIQRSLSRIATGEWYTFADFMKNATIAFGEENKIALKKFGKQWRYSTSERTPEEDSFIYSVLFNWLFESGLVQTGSLSSPSGPLPCLRLTPLGCSLFA